MNLFVCLHANAQQQLLPAASINTHIAKKPAVRFASPKSIFPATALCLRASTKQPINVIAGNYTISNYGFFCKQEIKLEKVTKVPFRFRLGSVAYTDMMEGKLAGFKLP